MSILRKEGKEKLHFKALNNKVTNSDFKRLKRLCLNCLDENPEISKILNENYRLIHVYFFYETRDKNVAESLKLVLDDQKVTFNSEPIPAISYSRKKIGCILVFLKHLEEITENRKDIQNFQAYKKNGLFEEFCHLAEQKGNSNFFPKTFWGLWNLYGSKGWLLYGNEVLARLDTDRNHYEVFSMMLKAYPDDWVKRFSKYFSQTVEFEHQYEILKKNIPTKITHARLVTDYLRDVNFLYVAEKAKDANISVENKKLLDTLIETGKKDVDGKRNLIEKEMGTAASSLIDSINESVFRTPEVFFSVILDLWKNLNLI